MKKITFILFALIAGTTFAQEEASAFATANAAAEIVSPIKITPEQDLNFGKVANNALGNVVVATDSGITGSSLSQIGSIIPKAASFDVTAADGFSYRITIPTSDVDLTHTNGTDVIKVGSFNHDAVASPQGTGVVQTIGVGATLNVVASQTTGVYTGTFDVTVTYE